jgi:translocator protein
MNASQVADAQRFSRIGATAFLFAGGTLALGYFAAWFSFTFIPSGPALTLPPIYPPPWVFWAVWLVIYPCWGVATSLVWEQRHTADVKAVMALYFLTLISNTLFLPIANLSGGNPAVLSLMDANGVVSSWVIAWLYTRYTRAAGLWMLPLLIWMPITLALKIWLYLVN